MDNRGRICWVTHFLPYPSTGHGALQRTHHLIRETARRFDVSLFVVSDERHAEEAVLSLGVKEVVFASKRSRTGRITSLLGSLVSGRSYWEELFFDPRLHQELVSHVSKTRSFVILDTIYLARYGDGIPSGRIIVNHHNIESLLLMQRSSHANVALRPLLGLQASRTRQLEQSLCQVVANNLVVSAEDKERLVEHTPVSRATIVPNGVDVDYFFERESTPSTDHAKLVFAGGMNWYPNADAMNWLARDIWPAVTELVGECKLTVVGRNPPSSLKLLSSKDPRVQLTGFVNDVRPYVHNATAYICPIRQGGGTRLKVLDALSMGSPLLATELAVDGLGLEDGIHYLKAESPADFASAFQRILEDRTLSSSLSNSGRRHVEANFSWRAIGGSLADELSQLLRADSTIS